MNLLKFTTISAIKYFLLIFFAISFNLSCFSHEKELSWEELSNQYKVPAAEVNDAENDGLRKLWVNGANTR